jgi:hypothetical protein
LAVVLLALVAVVPASADPPPQAGIVIRVDDEAFWYHCDPRAGICAVYGINPVDYCAGQWDQADSFSFQDIVLPQDDNMLRIVERARGTDIQTYVSSIETFGDCGQVGNYLATGTVRFEAIDNDVLVYLANRNNANAFGFTAHGDLVGADGARMQINAIYRLTWKPNGSVENEVSKINLK